MRHFLPLVVLVALVGTVVVGGFLAGGATAQDASPIPGSEVTTLILVEHAESITNVLQDASRVSVGDLQVWGPNPLFDDANATDTGATTQGSCIALNAEFDCLVNETIIFPDGSTLEIQGVELGEGAPSARTIVGGSGRYLGAAGTVSVDPTDDLAFWTKRIELVLPAD